MLLAIPNCLAKALLESQGDWEIKSRASDIFFRRFSLEDETADDFFEELIFSSQAREFSG